MNDIKRKNCPICKSSSYSPIKNYEIHDLVKCNNCECIFTGYTPTSENLFKYYSNYGEDHYVSPITIQRYHEVLDKFEKYRKNNNLLDLGSGFGHFLQEAKKRGWNVYGSDIAHNRVDASKNKGLITHAGVLDPKNYNNDFFDVITAFEVIEHLSNPLDEVLKIKKILRKGGAFFCTTPNFNSLMRFYLKNRYNILSYPEHLIYFTPKTLEYLFESNGFNKINLETTGISISRIKTSKSKSYQNFSAKTSADEKLRVAIEKNKNLKSFKLSINRLLNFFNLGMSMKGLFEKNN
jgi:2-polyprenyl-3-methyl-5-hydroxy-6-metoxy-1,4-benzoquinol methylase